MLSLVGALLLTAVIPLGLITTARERASFRQDTVLTARACAAISEDALTEPGQSPALTGFLARACRSGEAGWVYDAAGRLIAYTTAALPADDRPPAATVPAVLRTGGITLPRPARRTGRPGCHGGR